MKQISEFSKTENIYVVILDRETEHQKPHLYFPPTHAPTNNQYPKFYDNIFLLPTSVFI